MKADLQDLEKSVNKYPAHPSPLQVRTGLSSFSQQGFKRMEYVMENANNWEQTVAAHGAEMGAMPSEFSCLWTKATSDSKEGILSLFLGTH